MLIKNDVGAIDAVLRQCSRL